MDTIKLWYKSKRAGKTIEKEYDTAHAARIIASQRNVSPVNNETQHWQLPEGYSYVTNQDGSSAITRTNSRSNKKQ